MMGFNRNKSRTNYSDITRVPRPGTKLRAAYDRLLIAPGWVSSVQKNSRHDFNSKLRDFYGCEIQSNTKQGSKLIGRWDGDKFISREQLMGRLTMEEYANMIQ